MNALRHLNQHSRAELSIVFALLLFWLLPLSVNRLIAPDEGFYLFAARDVLRGEHPYVDFFYPQMPLVPYLYAGWFSLTGATWESARVLSAFCTALLGVLIFSSVRHHSGRYWAYGATIFYALTPWVWGWFLIAKPYALAALASCLMLSLSAVPSLLAAFLVGVALSIAGGCRLYFFALLPLALPNWEQDRPSGWRYTIAMLFGLFLGLLPTLLSASMGWEQFWFNNVGYHLIRAPEQGIPSRLSILGIASHIIPSSAIADYHLLFLLVLLALHPGVAWLKSQRIHPSWWYAVVLSAVSLVPSPAYYQYFCTAVPFLIVSASITLSTLTSSIVNTRVRTSTHLVLGIFLFCLLAFPLAHDVKRYTETGYGVLTPGRKPVPQFTIHHARTVGEAMESALPPGSKVLAMWPGHLFETTLRAWPCSENQFGYRAAERMGTTIDPQLHICSRAHIEQVIRNGEPDGIVFAPWSDGYFAPPYDALIAHGYRRVFNHGTVVGFAKGEPNHAP